MLLKKMKTFHHLDIYHLVIYLVIGTFAAQMSAQTNAQEAQVSQQDTVSASDFQLDEIEVSAKRVQQTTLSHQVTKSEDLSRENTGQNLP